jgi:hypothetical protein
VGNLKKRLERLERRQGRGNVVLVIKPGQTEEEAWKEHLALHHEDEKAETVFVLNYSHRTEKTPGREDP